MAEPQKVKLVEIRDRNEVKYFWVVAEEAVSPTFDNKASATEWLSSQSDYAV